MRLPSRWLRSFISGYRRDVGKAQRLRSPRMNMLRLEDRVTPTAPAAPPGFMSTTTNFMDSPGTTILDNATSEATISVSGVGTYLHDVDIFTNITHTWAADIQMVLISPAGTIVSLSTGNGGSNDNVFDGTLWDDQADPGNAVPYVTPLATSNMVTDTTYANLVVEATLTPEEALGAFIGENPNGTWTLRFRDTAGGDTGTLSTWKLDVTTLPSAPTINAPLNFANGSSTAIPDNSFVTSTISIGSAPAYLAGIKVTTNITHTNNANLDITLTSPTGKIVTLTTDNGGTFDNGFAGTVWDIDADPAGDVPLVAANSFLVTDTVYVDLTAESTLVPEESFAAFFGEDPNGAWVLTISDDAAVDTGTLNSWSIDIFTVGAGSAAPIASGSGTAIVLPEGTDHKVTVVYSDFGGSEMINFSTIGTGDVRIKAPDSSFLLPSSAVATPMSDAKSISVVYTFPALGGTWNVEDNGTYEIEVIDMQVFDKDTPTALSVAAGKVGTFAVNIPTNRVYGNTYLDVDASNSKTVGDTPVAGVLVYDDANNNMVFDSPEFPSINVPVTILDNVTVTSTLTITGFVGNINDLNVKVNITHTWVADMNISLIAPDGFTTIDLSSGNGGAGDNMINTVFDDQATGSVTAGVAPFTGSYIPEVPLSTFNGLDPNGTWTLQIADTAGGDTGTINGWSLLINNEASTISNANGDYFLTLANGVHNIRRVVPSKLVANTDPATGTHTVTLNNDSKVNRNFGHTPDPSPYVVSVTAANVIEADKTSHSVTVVYQDDLGSMLVDATKIDAGDIRILAPDKMTYLNPTSATATPNVDAQTISVVYEFPALGGKWDISDNGVYQVEVKAMEVFDKDGTALSAPAGTYGNFTVGIKANEIRGTTYFDANSNGKLDLTDTPVAGTVVYIDANNNMAFDGAIYPSTNVPVDVLDNTDAFSTLTIAGFVGTISDLNVQVNITHTWVADMNISLIAPDGVTTIDLSSGNGGAGDNMIDTVFDDQAAGSITTGAAPFTGSFIPEVPLATFNGFDPNGTWTLKISDTAGGDTGTINGWSLLINNEATTTSNAQGQYVFSLPDGTYNIRRLVPDLLAPNGDPVGGGYSVTLAADAAGNRNFGHLLDPTPLASATAANIKVAGGANHVVTVVYTDPEGSKLLNYSSIGVGDIRVKAPDNSYLIPISATPNPDPMGNAQTITVDYVIPAFGMDGKWDATDDGVYSIEVLGSQVFDVDTPTPLSVAAATIGQFKVLIPRTLVVTNVNDSGTGSLREAIIESGNVEAVDNITFAPGVTGSILLASSLPVINDSVNIIGPGASVVTIDGGTFYQIVRIIGPGTMDVTISGLTFANGVAGGIVNADQGGAIYVGDDNLTLQDCILTGNTSAANGGALYQGTYPAASAGNLTIINSTFSNNVSNGNYQAGGGLASNSTGIITISRSSFINNTQTLDGGGGAIGLYNNPTLNIVGSTFSGNMALKVAAGGFASGGAILLGLSNPTVNISNSTFSGNSGNNGGAIGTLFPTAGLTMNIVSSTFTLNSATTAGGAIHLSAATDVLNLSNSIVAQNTNPTSPNIKGAVTTATYNLISETDGATGITDPSNLTGTIAMPLDAKLGTLGLNGAPTGSPQTHKPLAGSPAIDQGLSALLTDQRDGKRPVDDPMVTNATGGNGSDIGAVELQASPTVTILTNGVVSGQHSIVTSIVVNFDQPVLITSPATAFTIFRTFNNTAGDTATGTVGYDVSGLDVNNYGTSVTLTFNSSGTLGALDGGGSLRDGKYTVTVLSAGITGLDSAMAANQAANTWRLFGDGNGDGVVNAADFNDFRLYYGSTNSIPGAIYDFNDDGLINAADFNAFRIRYGTSGYNMP